MQSGYRQPSQSLTSLALPLQSRKLGVARLRLLPKRTGWRWAAGLPAAVGCPFSLRGFHCEPAQVEGWAELGPSTAGTPARRVQHISVSNCWCRHALHCQPGPLLHRALPGRQAAHRWAAVWTKLQCRRHAGCHAEPSKGPTQGMCRHRKRHSKPWQSRACSMPCPLRCSPWRQAAAARAGCQADIPTGEQPASRGVPGGWVACQLHVFFFPSV